MKVITVFTGTIILFILTLITVAILSYTCAESVRDGSAAKAIGSFIHDVKEAAEGE